MKLFQAACTITLPTVDRCPQELASAGPIWPLLVVQCLVCCLSNGALPSIQSYSCLPYGNTVILLAITCNVMQCNAVLCRCTT